MLHAVIQRVDTHLHSTGRRRLDSSAHRATDSGHTGSGCGVLALWHYRTGVPRVRDISVRIPAAIRSSATLSPAHTPPLAESPRTGIGEECRTLEQVHTLGLEPFVATSYVKLYPLPFIK